MREGEKFVSKLFMAKMILRKMQCCGSKVSVKPLQRLAECEAESHGFQE